MDIKIIDVLNPDAKNLIFGQSHFIKTVEDLHELIVSAVPGAQFGLAFCEASGERLIRKSGTNEKMIDLAVQNASLIACGHTFILFLENIYPINVLTQIKLLPEVANIFAATANSLQVVIAETTQGRGVMGIIDGGKPAGIETDSDIKNRTEFLRTIGYKK